MSGHEHPCAVQGLSLEQSVSQFSHTMTAQADLRVEAAHLRRFLHNFRVRRVPYTLTQTGARQRAADSAVHADAEPCGALAGAHQVAHLPSSTQMPVRRMQLSASSTAGGLPGPHPRWRGYTATLNETTPSLPGTAVP